MNSPNLRFAPMLTAIVMALAFAGTLFAAVPISPVTDAANQTALGKIENENLRVTFIPAMRAGQATVRPVVSAMIALTDISMKISSSGMPFS